MHWTQICDETDVLLKFVEWKLSQIFPSVFLKGNSIEMNSKLESIIRNTGLTTNEVEITSSDSIGLFESFFHKCLKWILLLIIIVGGAYLIHRITYVPGTLYGSIKSMDFS